MIILGKTHHGTTLGLVMKIKPENIKTMCCLEPNCFSLKKIPFPIGFCDIQFGNLMVHLFRQRIKLGILSFPGIEILMIKFRFSRDCLIFVKGSFSGGLGQQSIILCFFTS